MRTASTSLSWFCWCCWELAFVVVLEGFTGSGTGRHPGKRWLQQREDGCRNCGTCTIVREVVK